MVKMNKEVCLNQNWIKDKVIDLDGIAKLEGVHAKRIDLFNRIEKETDIVKLHEMAKEIDEIDFELQDGWGFDRDKRYHTWWYRLPKCTCPKMDNKDRLGTDYCIINRDCPLHGGRLE
jgi:hypothetical protein